MDEHRVDTHGRIDALIARRNEIEHRLAEIRQLGGHLLDSALRSTADSAKRAERAARNSAVSAGQGLLHRAHTHRRAAEVHDLAARCEQAAAEAGIGDAEAHCAAAARHHAEAARHRAEAARHDAQAREHHRDAASRHDETAPPAPA